MNDAELQLALEERDHAIEDLRQQVARLQKRVDEIDAERAEAEREAHFAEVARSGENCKCSVCCGF